MRLLLFLALAAGCDDSTACSKLTETQCTANASCAADYCSMCGCTPAPYVGCREASAKPPQCMLAPCVSNACAAKSDDLGAP
jgi:hypothetical protein